MPAFDGKARALEPAKLRTPQAAIEQEHENRVVLRTRACVEVGTLQGFSNLVVTEARRRRELLGVQKAHALGRALFEDSVVDQPPKEAPERRQMPIDRRMLEALGDEAFLVRDQERTIDGAARRPREQKFD